MNTGTYTAGARIDIGTGISVRVTASLTDLLWALRRLARYVMMGSSRQEVTRWGHVSLRYVAQTIMEGHSQIDQLLTQERGPLLTPLSLARRFG